VTEIGAVVSGADPGRRNAEELTLFKSGGRRGRRRGQPRAGAACLKRSVPSRLARSETTRKTHRRNHRSHTVGPPGARTGIPRRATQAREPPTINAYKTAGRRQRRRAVVRCRAPARRLDDQRRQRRSGCRIRGAGRGRAVHGRRDRDGARRELERMRALGRDARARAGMASPGRRSMTVRIPASRGRSSIHSTIRTS